MKFKHIPLTLQSVIYEPVIVDQKRVSTIGIENHRAKIASFRPVFVALYTILTLSTIFSPFSFFRVLAT